MVGGTIHPGSVMFINPNQTSSLPWPADRKSVGVNNKINLVLGNIFQTRIPVEIL